MRVHRVLPVGVCVLLAAAVVFAGSNPVAVSPGDASRLVLIGDACPTFSWGEVDEAKSYELVVYQVGEEGEAARAVLRQRIPGTATGWTPSLDRCLQRGGRYAWSVRAAGGEAVSAWSAPSLFQVAAGASQAEFEAALQVVRSYLDAGGGAASSTGAAAETEAESEPEPGAEASSPVPAAVGTTELSVEGGVVAASFTGDGSTLTALDPANLSGGECEGFPISGRRYIDRGDGTVRDCNTGKIWLKDASCLGRGTGDDDYGTSVFTLVADLNDTGVGSDFGCTDYTEGTHADWEVPEITDLCGLWSGECTGTSCCTAAQGLVDTSVSGSPKVADGTGDAKVTPGNVFFGLWDAQNFWWSATDDSGLRAWVVLLHDGDVWEIITFEALGRVWPVRTEE